MMPGCGSLPELMDRKNFDCIIVESNAKMLKVINWYLANKEWLDKEEFQTPIENGVIILREEKLDVLFEKKADDLIEISVYPGDGRAVVEAGSEKRSIDVAVLTYSYRPSDHWIGNRRFPSMPKEKRAMLELVLGYDRTDWKESIKYHALMMFASYYKEIVKVDEKQNIRRSKHEAKMLGRKPGQPLQLVRKTYVVSDFDEKQLPRADGKRKYSKPDHEVSVRGYYRTSKTGKRTWVRPFVKYKGKKKVEPKNYFV